MVIAIFRSLEDESLEDFSIRLAQQWRIGQKGLDNGVILVVFVQERKIRFEVGYGLEPILPDAIAGQIIREVITPRFRERRYAAGLEGAVNAVFARVGPSKGTPAPPGRSGRPQAGMPPLWAVLAVFAIFGVVGVILLQEMFSAQRRLRGRLYTAGRDGWSAPIVFGPSLSGAVGGGGSIGGGGGFSGGGGSFGGGGASGEW